MHKKLFYLISVVILTSLIISCSNSSKVNHSKKTETDSIMTGKRDAAGPPAIIYKTTTDYYDRVSVTLSVDKTEIVSYPGIKDVYYKGELAYPTKLNDGFLLDNRGIDVNSAFLKMTYEEYSKLDATPSKEELFELIIDKDPFTEMYHCGSKYKYKDLVNELNDLIAGKKLDQFEKLK
jgi:hypothetical protein